MTAIDISPLSIQSLRERAKAEGLDGRLRAQVMDAMNLVIDDHTIDVVIGGGILHHLTNLDAALSEIGRVLKPGGRAVFHEPLGLNPFINLYRRLTPLKRTLDERPLDMRAIQTIYRHFLNSELYFFDCTTLLAKALRLMRMKRLANSIEAPLIKLDQRLLTSKSKRISFTQKMAWIVIIDFHA